MKLHLLILALSVTLFASCSKDVALNPTTTPKTDTTTKHTGVTPPTKPITPVKKDSTITPVKKDSTVTVAGPRHTVSLQVSEYTGQPNYSIHIFTKSGILIDTITDNYYQKSFDLPAQDSISFTVTILNSRGSLNGKVTVSNNRNTGETYNVVTGIIFNQKLD